MLIRYMYPTEIFQYHFDLRHRIVRIIRHKYPADKANIDIIDSNFNKKKEISIRKYKISNLLEDFNYPKNKNYLSNQNISYRGIILYFKS